MIKNVFSFAVFCAAALAVQAQEVILVEGNPSVPNSIQFDKFSYLDGETIFQKNDALKMDFSKDFYQKSPNNSPFSPLIAAAALDSKNNAMVYLPMVSQSVYVYDLKSKSLSKIDWNSANSCSCTEASLFNRMATAKNGLVYALNNDGSALLEIDVAQKKVTNLGAINENPDFKERTKAWGGDMIADADGTLYIVSAMANVYQLSVSTKDAKFIGTIKGLPQNYTTNAAAVLENGQILLANSSGKEMYSFDMNSLQAKFYGSAQNPIYDMASSYVVGHENDSETTENTFSLYPTQVTNKQIRIAQNTTDKAIVQVVIYDLYNQVVFQQKNVSISASEEKNIALNSLKPGIYIVKIIGENGSEQFQQKITVTK